MYGINNRSNGVLRMQVTTSVTHKPEVRIYLLTFLQMVSDFALELYSKLCSFHNLFVNRIHFIAPFPTNTTRISFIGKLRMHKINAKTTVPLDVEPNDAPR